MSNTLDFIKYQSAGNNFIVINSLSLNDEEISIITPNIDILCDINYGIGADGLIIVSLKNKLLDIQYFNKDGSKSFCGNGTCCVVDYLNSINKLCSDISYHSNGVVFEPLYHNGYSSITIIKDIEFRKVNNLYYVNNGSPHILKLLNPSQILNDLDLSLEIENIVQNSDIDKNNNFSFFKVIDRNRIEMRTHERGVESETLSCGSAAMASVYILSKKYLEEGEEFKDFEIKFKGGTLNSKLIEENSGNNIKKMSLSSSAKAVFSGKIDVNQYI